MLSNMDEENMQFSIERFREPSKNEKHSLTRVDPRIEAQTPVTGPASTIKWS